jgi:putative glutamine amidotransferase
MKIGCATYDFYSSINQNFPTTLTNSEPVDVVSTKKPVEYFDLIIFTGGEDINPEIYGENFTYSFSINPWRDEIEANIFRQAVELNKKILGICRGHQLINALLGGKLVQDINIELGFTHRGLHSLEILEEDSLIAEILKGRTLVNSMHHQGVIIPGRNLRATSFYNGVFESTEGENIISVQWHPEFMRDRIFFSKLIEWAKR